MQEPLEAISFNFDFICLFTYEISLWYVENARCINKRDARPLMLCLCLLKISYKIFYNRFRVIRVQHYLSDFGELAVRVFLDLGKLVPFPGCRYRHRTCSFPLTWAGTKTEGLTCFSVRGCLKSLLCKSAADSTAGP